jgi:hypothetical protein
VEPGDAGSYTVEPEATLSFDGGGVKRVITGPVNSTGTLRFSAGSTTLSNPSLTLGDLRLTGGTLAIPGAATATTYAQMAGTLAVVGGPQGTAITVTGTDPGAVNLAGTLTVTAQSDYMPVENERFRIITGSRNGTFSTVNNAIDGGLLFFRPDYSDPNLVDLVVSTSSS